MKKLLSHPEAAGAAPAGLQVGLSGSLGGLSGALRPNVPYVAKKVAKAEKSHIVATRERHRGGVSRGVSKQRPPADSQETAGDCPLSPLCRAEEKLQ